jgi:microcystin-dependent protein
MDPFVGEIRLFAFSVIPRGWLACQGQTLAVAQNQALFALLGTIYGGDGKTNFKLPDLRGRVLVGNQPSTPPAYPGPQGTSAGTETVALTLPTVSAHTHALTADSGTANSQRAPAGNLLASGGTASQLIYGAASNLVALNPVTISTNGGGTPRPNMQPYLVMQYCMATQGIFPQRQ